MYCLPAWVGGLGVRGGRTTHPLPSQFARQTPTHHIPQPIFSIDGSNVVVASIALKTTTNCILRHPVQRMTALSAGSRPKPWPIALHILGQVCQASQPRPGCTSHSAYHQKRVIMMLSMYVRQRTENDQSILLTRRRTRSQHLERPPIPGTSLVICQPRDG